MLRKIGCNRALPMSMAFCGVALLVSYVSGSPVPPPKCDNICIMPKEAFLAKTGQCILFDEVTCEKCDGTIATVCEPVGNEDIGTKCGYDAIIRPIKQYNVLPDKFGNRCTPYCVPKFGEA